MNNRERLIRTASSRMSMDNVKWSKFMCAIDFFYSDEKVQK